MDVDFHCFGGWGVQVLFVLVCYCDVVCWWMVAFNRARPA
jgi:hypothetical protein